MRAKKFQVVLLSTMAACIYGIIHDQITARICLEYFTLAHPPLFPTAPTTLLALCWGIAATIGIGAMLGFILALVSQSGNTAPYPLPRVVRAILILLAAMAASAVLSGILGYQLTERGIIAIPDSVSRILPIYKHAPFMAVWFAHCASYLVGLAGGAVICFRIWHARGRPSVISVFPRTKAGAWRVALLIGGVAFAIWFRFRSR